MLLYQRKFNLSTNLQICADYLSLGGESIPAFTGWETGIHPGQVTSQSHTQHIHSPTDTSSEPPVKLLCLFLDRERKLEETHTDTVLQGFRRPADGPSQLQRGHNWRGWAANCGKTAIRWCHFPTSIIRTEALLTPLLSVSHYSLGTGRVKGFIPHLSGLINSSVCFPRRRHCCGSSQRSLDGCIAATIKDFETVDVWFHYRSPDRTRVHFFDGTFVFLSKNPLIWAKVVAGIKRLYF